MAIENTEKQQAEVSKLMLKWQRDWKYSEPYFDERKDHYLAYKMFRDPNLHPYKYNPIVPLLFSITENWVSTVFNAFFQKDKTMQIDPVEGVHAFNQNIRDEDIARQLEKAVNTLSMHPDREFMLDKYDLDMETALFGNGYTITKPVFDYSKTSEIGGPVYLGPKVEHISFWDLVPDRRAYRMSNAEHIWHLERDISEEQLLERIKNEGYIKIDKEDIKQLFSNPDWIPKDYHDDLLKTLGKTAGRDLGGGFNERDGTIMLLHHYNTRTGHYTTIAGNRLVVRDTSIPQTVELPSGNVQAVFPPFPYNPYDDIRLWPFPKEWFASGTGSIVTGFQRDIELLKSMRLENLELAIHRVFLVNDNYNVDVDDLYMIPGGIIPVNDVDKAIKILDTGAEITRDAHLEEGNWRKDAEDASSSHDPLRGGATQRRETATNTVQTIQQGQKRAQTFLTRSGNWFKSVSLKQIIQIRQYMSQREYERIIGEPDAGFYQLSMDEIQRMFDLKPASASLDVLREIEKQNTVNALQLFQGNEDLLRRPNWARLIFEQFFPDKNPEKYIITEQESQQQQQQLQAQQAQGQPGGQPTNQPGNQGTPAGQTGIDPAQLIQGALDGSNAGRPGPR